MATSASRSSSAPFYGYLGIALVIGAIVLLNLNINKTASSN